MAEVFVSYAIEKMVSRVGSLFVEGINFTWGFKGKLKKLKESLLMIETVMQDAEIQQATKVSVRLWLEKLQDIAYDAEDILDEFAYEILHQQVHTRNNYLMGKVHHFFSFSNSIAFRLNMALKIEKIIESLDELDKEASRCGLNRVSSVDGTPPQPSLNRETDSFLDNSEIVVGRKDDVSKVVDLLPSSSTNQRALSIIPIVGMGGVGKTTLAKLVCQVVEERKLFDRTFWVCVSEDFDDRRILGGMLETLDKSTGGVNNIDAILRHLKTMMEDKSFFLVLDDVWNEEPRTWDSLKRRLSEISGSKRSSVVITTRSKKVAAIVETSPDCRHEMKQLSDDETWSIIRNIVSRNGREPIPAQLQAIGKDIAKKCDGVPLVAKVLGGLLFSNKDEHNWLSIRNNYAFEALKNNNELLPILKLSFDNLPSQSLKICFAYCSIFPKDSVIDKEQLIQLWIAEGLLRSSHERKKDTMEDIGDKYFNDLLDRFFFQDVRRDEFQNIKDFMMHDLMHDLALLISKPETLILEVGTTVGDPSRVRRLNLISRYKIDEPKFPSARKLYALFSRVDVLKSWKFKSLRTLNLEGAYIKELPTSISKLKHLRYLDVSYSNIKAFPESITSLYHLQTLRASECWHLDKLPKKMQHLVSLRHLYLPEDIEMPAHMGCLTNLRTLHPPVFVIGPNKGYKIEEFGGLKELRGEWRIVKLELLMDKKEAESADLFGKEKISRLVLEWSRWGRESSNCNRNDEEVLEGLQVHPAIRSLTIKNYLGEKFPQWLLMPHLNNLMELKIKDCFMFKQLPSLGHLRCLEFLEIEGNGMEGVTCMGKEFYGGSCSENVKLFPALKRFSLKKMESLVEWIIPDDAAAGDGALRGVAAVFPCLEELYIEKCPKLKSIPSMSTHPSSKLRKLLIRDCGSLSHLPGDFLTSSYFLGFELYAYGSPAFIPIIECGSALEELRIISESERLDCSLFLEIYSRFSPFKSTSTISLDHQSLGHSLEDFFRCLTELKRMEIGPLCRELEEYPARILNSIHHYLSGSLEVLTIHGWYNLKSGIPHQLQHLTALKELYIYDFNGLLEALPDWLGNLSSLQRLWIIRCQNLKYLPSSASFQRLSKLEFLYIRGCPHLSENCREGNGPEWPKISHIRWVFIYPSQLLTFVPWSRIQHR